MPGNYVIAGGTKGIGLALVQRLRRHADQVVVYARQVGDLPLDSVVRFESCDFSLDGCEMPNLPEIIHGVAYCPGSIQLRSFKSLKLADFQQDLQINLLGAVQMLHQCLPGLGRVAEPGRASAVLFSTVAVAQGLPMHASIAAAKGAIEGLARSLAAEWAPKIRVNAVAPALTQTPLAAKFFANPASAEALAARYPLGRTGLPDDIASMAEFLLGDQSTWLTGQTLGVDGGMSTLRK